MSQAAARQLVLEVLRSVQGSEPDLAMPLVQAGLDSLGNQRNMPPCIQCFLADSILPEAHWHARQDQDLCDDMAGTLNQLAMSCRRSRSEERAGQSSGHGAVRHPGL